MFFLFPGACSLRGAAGDVLVGGRARARLAGGYFFVGMVCLFGAYHSKQNKKEIIIRARAHPNWCARTRIGGTCALGPRAHPNSPRSLFLFLNAMVHDHDEKNKK